VQTSGRRLLRSAERNREVVDRALEKAGVWRQKRYARLVRQFERSRFKLTRLIAARTLAEESSDPALVAKAYDYILANQPPQEYSRLLDLAGRLRKLGRFGDAEGLYREALVQKPGDKDSTDRLVEVLRLMERGAEADELVRQYERLIGFRGLLEDAIIHAKQYRSTGRAGRIAPAVLALLDSDEEPQRALWSMTMPISSGVGFAVRTDRRLLIVQDYEYLRSGTLLQPTVIHRYYERHGQLDRKLFG
jgi:tetratricopeptide (TPR) repeat protein